MNSNTFSIVALLIFCLSGCGAEVSPASSSSSSSSSSTSSSSSSSSGSQSNGPWHSGNCNMSTPENWPCSWSSDDGSYGGCSHGAGCGWSYPIASSSSSSSSSGSNSYTSSSSSGGASSSSSSSGYTYSSDERIEEYCQDAYSGSAANASSSGGPSYPLRTVLDEGRMITVNGDFEDPSIGADAIMHNQNALYVYSGNGSAHLVQDGLLSSLSEDSEFHFSKVTFWIYSVSDETAEYEVELNGGRFVCGGDYLTGFGYRTPRSRFNKTVEVEPHVWVPVSMETTPEVGNHNVWLRITRSGSEDGTSEFYIDDLMFHGHQ